MLNPWILCFGVSESDTLNHCQILTQVPILKQLFSRSGKYPHTYVRTMPKFLTNRAPTMDQSLVVSVVREMPHHCAINGLVSYSCNLCDWHSSLWTVRSTHGFFYHLANESDLRGICHFYMKSYIHPDHTYLTFCFFWNKRTAVFCLLLRHHHSHAALQSHGCGLLLPLFLFKDETSGAEQNLAQL